MKDTDEVSPCCGVPVVQARAYQAGEHTNWYECMLCCRPTDPITRKQWQQILLNRRTVGHPATNAKGGHEQTQGG